MSRLSKWIIFLAVVAKTYCVLESPDFQSQWKYIAKSVDCQRASHMVDHGLGETPLLVDVQVKAVDGPNKGFIFQAAGHQIGDAAENITHSGVIYIYNDRYVRVSGPVSEDGYCIMIEEDYWTGPTTSQMSDLSMFRVRAWKRSSLPQADFVRTTTIKAGTGKLEDSYFEYNQGFFPSFIVVRIKFPKSAKKYPKYYADSMGATHATNKLLEGGYVVYGYSYDHIRVWASTDSPYLYKGGHGFAFDVEIKTASIEIYAWMNTSIELTSLHSVDFDPVYDELKSDFIFTYYEEDEVFVRALVSPNDGNNINYCFVGTGTSATYDIRNESSVSLNGTAVSLNGTAVSLNETAVSLNGSARCTYGGLIYAYSGQYVRFWLPKSYAGAYGAPICISGLGSEQNTQASYNGSIYYLVWKLNKNQCKTGFCKNGAYCHFNGTTTCSCLDGWTGADCSIDVNECAHIYCHNDGTCVNYDGSYHCMCHSYYSGKYCEIVKQHTNVENRHVSADSVPLMLNSNGQLENVNLFTIYIPGIAKFDEPTYSIINERYVCSNVLMKIIPKKDNNTDSKSITMRIIRQPGPLCEETKPNCTIEWGDNTVPTSVEFKDDAMEVNHTYRYYGVYSAYMECQGDYTFTCPDSNTECVANTNFLDDYHKSFQTPIVFLSTERVELKTLIEYTDVECGEAEYNWRIVSTDGESFTTFTAYEQQKRTYLTIEEGVLPPGVYIVTFELLFKYKSSKHWSDDSVVLQLVLPDIETNIEYGDFVDVPFYSYYYVSAYKSYDPASSQTSLIGEDLLIANWTFAVFTDFQSVQMFPESFPNTSSLSDMQYYYVYQGGAYHLYVDTSYFHDGAYAVAVFKLARGHRSSVAYQIIRIRHGIEPVYLYCLYNCQSGQEKTFKYDKVSYSVHSGYSDPTYLWDIYVLNHATKQFEDVTSEIELQTARTDPAFSAAIGSLQQGNTYKIRVTVSSGIYYSNAEIIRTVNYVPYNGTCETSSTEVTATKALVYITCSNWIVKSASQTGEEVIDDNPSLRFTIYQMNTGSLVLKELLTTSQFQHNGVYLKVGDSSSNYVTTLSIRISDKFSNTAETTVSITSKPPFNTSHITATEEDAAIIRDYSEEVVTHLTYLDKYGTLESAVSFLSLATCTIHEIELPEWAPPVERVLNSNGFILDLSENGNVDLSSFDDLYSDIDNETIDPTTLAIQDMYGTLLLYLQNVFENEILNPYSRRSRDPNFMTLCTNAVSNLGNSFSYLSNETKEIFMNLSSIVGVTALDTAQNSVEEDQVEKTASDINSLTNSLVMSSVPNSLRQFRNVENMAASRRQIADYLAILGDNIDIINASISPLERAYTYIYQQIQLKKSLDDSKAAAYNASIQAIDYLNKVQNSWKMCSVCSNEDSKSTTQVLKRNTAEFFSKNVTNTTSGSFQLTSLNSDLGSSTESVNISAFEFSKNIYMYDDDGMSSHVSSKVLRIDAKVNGSDLKAGKMMFEQKVDSVKPVRITPNVDIEDASQFMYHQFLYQKTTDDVCIRVIPVDDVENVTSYKVYLNFEKSPSILEYDFIIYIEKDEKWMACVLSSQMGGHTGVIYLGIYLPESMQTKDYYFAVFTMGCLTWEESARKWHPDKCQMELIPEKNKIRCYCNNITDMVFGNSFVVAPNSIDFSAVFLKFSPLSQAAVMGTLAALYILYILAVILLRKRDRRDALKWGITPLRDNIITDESYYIIKVHTGMRPGAGTRSRVAFKLTGHLHDTGPRELFDGVREEFSTGSTVSLFMTTRYNLGELLHLHIWHDNSGEGDMASWYLNQVIVYDIEHKQTYTFEAERWLSVEDGVSAELSSRPQQQPVQFETRFFYQTKNRLSDSHMWVSIMFRPELSTFTRVQRLSCALLYMFLNMIASAMFFNPDPDYEMPVLFQLGPFSFTPQQIYVSIISAMVTMPPTMFLIFLFKRTKRRIRPLASNASLTKAPGLCCNCCSCCYSQCRKKRKKYIKSPESETSYKTRLESKLLSPEEPDFNGQFYFPHWCVYVTWSFFVGGVVSCSFFILLFSMQWGKQKSEKWLTTFFLSMLESILFVDPFMVISVAIVMALLIKSNKENSNTDMNVVIENYKKLVGLDKDNLDTIMLVLRSITLDYNDHESKPRNVVLPLQGTDLEHAAEEYKHKSKLKALAWDLLYGFAFIIIVVSICFANRSDNSYLHHMNIMSTFAEPAGLPKFSQIKTQTDFLKWVNASILPAVMPEYDLHGEHLHWTKRQFAKDGYNIRLGPPRLRQLRMSKGYCSIPHIGNVKCFQSYNMISEETRDFCPGWKHPPCEANDNLKSDAWKFTSALNIWGLPVPGSYATYGGGGYIAQFDINYGLSVELFNELFDNLWVDRHTMAVFLEFTLYNGFTNIFVYCKFLIELPETGGAFTSYQIYPLRLYQHVGPIGAYTLACEVVFVVFLMVMFGKVSARIFHQRCDYFKQFWRVYDIVILALGIAICIIYAFRLGLSHLTIQNYKKDKNMFVNFAHIVLWDELLVTLLGCLAFMATMHILEAFGTSKRISAVVKVFETCGKDLFWYSVMFIYVLFGFCFLGVLLFGSKLESYMNVYECLGTLFISLIGKSKFAEIEETAPIFAKLFFAFYIITTVFFIMTIFLAILCGTIDEVVKDIRKDQKPDLINMLFSELNSLISGFKSSIGPSAVSRQPLNISKED